MKKEPTLDELIERLKEFATDGIQFELPNHVKNKLIEIFNKAVGSIEKTAKKEKSEHKYMSAAELRTLGGHKEKAVQDLTQALKFARKHKSHDSLWCLVDELAKAGMIDEAKDLRDKIEDASDKDLANFYIAYELAEQSKYKDALDLLPKIKAPEHTIDLFVQLGECKLRDGDKRAASEYLKEAIDTIRTSRKFSRFIDKYIEVANKQIELDLKEDAKATAQVIFDTLKREDEFEIQNFIDLISIMSKTGMELTKVYYSATEKTNKKRKELYDNRKKAKQFIKLYEENELEKPIMDEQAEKIANQITDKHIRIKAYISAIKIMLERNWIGYAHEMFSKIIPLIEETYSQFKNEAIELAEKSKLKEAIGKLEIGHSMYIYNLGSELSNNYCEIAKSLAEKHMFAEAKNVVPGCDRFYLKEACVSIAKEHIKIKQYDEAVDTLNLIKKQSEKIKAFIDLSYSFPKEVAVERIKSYFGTKTEIDKLDEEKRFEFALKVANKLLDFELMDLMKDYLEYGEKFIEKHNNSYTFPDLYSDLAYLQSKFDNTKASQSFKKSKEEIESVYNNEDRRDYADYAKSDKLVHLSKNYRKAGYVKEARTSLEEALKFAKKAKSQSLFREIRFEFKNLGYSDRANEIPSNIETKGHVIKHREATEELLDKEKFDSAIGFLELDLKDEELRYRVAKTCYELLEKTDALDELKNHKPVDKPKSKWLFWR
ncbi:hypothetical protein KY312_02160 [Candidatus Woesearchaeota archaeon]|nr:hypothetical protein [Candidatus Woesearchaeota archaeon]